MATATVVIGMVVVGKKWPKRLLPHELQGLLEATRIARGTAIGKFDYQCTDNIDQSR